MRGKSVNRYRTLMNGLLLGVALLIFLPKGVAAFLMMIGEIHFVEHADIYQDMLFAKAIFHRMDPYLPLSELHNHLSSSLIEAPPRWYSLNQATPHPPTTFLFTFWMAWLEPQAAYVGWLFVEIGMLAATLFLSIQLFQIEIPLSRFLFLLLLFLSATYVEVEMLSGQFGLLTGFFLALFVYLQRNHYARSAGISLGIAISIKFLGIAFLPFLFFQGRWKTLTISLVTCVFLFLSSSLWVPLSALPRYFFVVLPESSQLFGNHPSNISLWRVPRLLYEQMEPLLDGILSKGSLEQTEAVWCISGTVALAIVVGIFLYRAAREQRYLSVLLLSCVISPISWVHYLTLLIPLMVALLREAKDKMTPLLLFVIFYLIEPLNSALLSGGDGYVSASLSPHLYPVLPLVTIALLLRWLWSHEHRLLSVDSWERPSLSHVDYDDESEHGREPKQLVMKGDSICAI